MFQTSLIDIFVRHRVAANLAMIMMVLGGLWAADRITTQLDPAISWPVVFVRVDWPGASAEDVEKLIVVPIEQQLKSLVGLRNLSSTTWNGSARIRVEFTHATDMIKANDEVKQRIDSIRHFPRTMEPLQVARAQDYEYISAVLVTGEGTRAELIPLVRRFREELLARGIERIDFEGVPEEELAIQVPLQTLYALNATLDDIAEEVRRRSSNTPAGTVGLGQDARQLRSLDQKREVHEFEQLDVALESQGRLLRLGDIAAIDKRPKEGEAYLTRDGKPAIVMHLERLTQTDAITTADILQDWLADTRDSLPRGVELHVYQEVWMLLKHQLEMIFENGLSGLVLVILTLFLFLNGRVGWWVMIGIPVSFLFATLLYYALFDGGINILALITFVMALGIVVDDAIVVGEDAATLFAQGMSPEEAAAQGARRMFLPVVTSSLTTMAAFVPLLITGGDIGQFIVTLPTVLLCVIVASLVECFLVLPGHLKHSFENIDRQNPGRIRQWFDPRFERIREHYYRPLLARALAYPGTTLSIALACVVLAFSLAIGGHVGVNFVTGIDIESLEANVEFGASASDADRDRFMSHLEQALVATSGELGDENVNGYNVKYNRARLNEENKTGSQFASLEVEFAWEEERSVTPGEFVDAWREQVRQPAYVEQLQIGVEGGANNGMPDISLVLRGQDIPTLKQAAEELSDALLAYEGVSNVFDDLPYGRDQLVFSLTPTGKSLGLTTESLGQQLRDAYNGARVQIFNQDEVELEVMVMLPDSEREQLALLKQVPVQTPSGEMVALGMVAELRNRRGIDVINHNNGYLSVSVSASVDSEVNNTQQVLAHLEDNALKDIREKYGLSSGLSGVTERNQQIVSTMTLGAMLTLIFIYLILAWSFASYIWPLAVMTAIPLGLTGAIVGHWVMGFDIGAMSMLAFFSLTGIVVNDSIVLVSFFRRNLDAGMSMLDAINEASISRFRAVILTSLTTIAGLTPLMFEASTLALYMVPIAITICFGLAFATLLVLMVIPAIIVLLEDWRNQFAGLEWFPEPQTGVRK